MNRVRPLFLFSLSRSGSTLLQRMLATHPLISTRAEPWLLLPIWDMLEHDARTFSVYGHELAIRAVMEFADGLPGGRRALRDRPKALALDLYAEAADENARYFLDKTPAYSLICRQVMEMFPEGRFVWLTRNPLAVAASLMETFADGKWYLYRRFHELYLGLSELVACHEANHDAMLKLRYEDLLCSPEAEMARLFEYLDIPAEDVDWRQFAAVDLRGSMQDPTGVKAYDALASEPLTKWRQSFDNPFRQSWARRYLRWIGRERLSLMGYDLDEMLAELDSIPVRVRGMAGDALRHLYGLWRVYSQADAAALMRRQPEEKRGALH